MKKVAVIFGLVFILASALSLTGCQDKGGGEIVKTAEEVEAEKAKAHQEKWRAIIAKKESGEKPSPKEAPAQRMPEDSPQAKAEAKRKAEIKKARTGSRGFSTPRLEYARKNGVPAEYGGLTAPTGGSWKDDIIGRDLYKKNCSSCHGSRAKGDSAMGRALTPPASDLIRVMAASEVTDGYLFWAMTEGGRALGTAMPSFKDLSKEDRWRIVAALRKGLK